MDARVEPGGDDARAVRRLSPPRRLERRHQPPERRSERRALAQ
jgi:hypothetical protein